MLPPGEPLDERKQIILKAIVHDYTSAGIPVSSEMLAYRYRLGVRSATIRNEMAEMSEMGYLRQPHTSAGRVPSDLGYRFYVDRLMSGPGLSSDEESGVLESYNQAPAETESLLHLTCRLLSALTHQASVAMESTVTGATIKHISLSLIDDRRLLLAVVASDGRVEHSILELRKPAIHRAVSRLSQVLTEQFSGLRVDGVHSPNLDSPPDKARDLAIEYQIAVRALRQLCRGISDGDVYVEGSGHILSQPEFKESKKLEALIEAFEERRALYQTLSAALLGPETTIIIGSENPYPEMRDCSFVTANFRIGGLPRGAIGIIGPTRMNYRRAVASVNLLTRNLNELLAAIGAK